MKILIVDDSKVMRSIVKRTLRQAGFGGHDVIEAANGTEGLNQVKAESPDIVLCDWNMPEMNGIDLLRELRAAGNDVKFGFVTSEGTPEMRETGEQAGAQFFITKPFTAEDFEQTLNPHLAAA